MIQASRRYNNFLNNYEFYPNSVHFRIHSSKALEKFKNVQAFQLNQLANGKYHFAPDRREILLLKYDMWSRWLFEIENLMIELSGNHLELKINEKDINTIISLALKTSETYKEVISIRHPESFNESFVKIWLDSHEVVFSYMISAIKQIKGFSFDIAYSKIVDILVEVMQYTLIEIYELDSVFCKLKIKCEDCPENYICPKNKKDDSKEDIFIVITPLIEKCFKLTGVCLASERIKVYEKHFNFKEIYLKNYTDAHLPERTVLEIENLGTAINYRKSLINI